MMPPDSSDLPMVNLRPGELYVAREPTLITTLLGSCISVCLYNPKTKTGAMCHGVLPFFRSSRPKGSFHFVDSSIAYMVEVLGRQQKTAPRHLEAKLFGGANVLALGRGRGKNEGTVGGQNIQAARLSLGSHGVPILVERVGGDRGCKLFFYAHTGEVLLHSLRPQPFAPGTCIRTAPFEY